MSDQDRASGSPGIGAGHHLPTILVADADATARQLLKHLLENQGFRVLETDTDLEILSLSAGNALTALIVDPEVSRQPGATLVRELKAIPRLRNTPILVCSGQSDREYVLGTMRAGAAAYILKPFHRGKFLDKLRSAIRGAGGGP